MCLKVTRIAFNWNIQFSKILIADKARASHDFSINVIVNNNYITFNISTLDKIKVEK
jgi:hypothetical protein